MIRIRHPQGTCTFKLPTNDGGLSLAAALQHFIQEQTGIPVDEQELKTGYPPRPLSPNKLSPGDQVLVSRTASAPAPAATDGRANAPAPAREQPPPLRPPQGQASGQGQRQGQDSASVALGQRGHVTLTVVPDDNSCLFNAVGFLLHQRLGSDICNDLRQVVANAIRADPDTYPDVILGQPRETYMAKIQSPQTWGGAIELSILSTHLQVEIDAIDIASGVVHRFGQDSNFGTRGVLVYSGIHYDALALLPTPGAPSEFATTLFDITDDAVLNACIRLCSTLKQQGYYTDTARFTLRCKACGHTMTGEKEAVQHATATGHTDFGET